MKTTENWQVRSAGGAVVVQGPMSKQEAEESAERCGLIYGSRFRAVKATQKPRSLPLIVRARKLRMAGLADVNRLKADAALTVVAL